MELPGDIIAFLPVIELGEQNLNEVFEVNKEYDFAVVSLDPKEHKMVLTLPGNKPVTKKENEESQETPVS